MSSKLTHADIAALIPHSGTMCLLAQLEAWDLQHIVCTATNHRDTGHPLRTRRGLLAPTAIEYAAQAMALHGALLAMPSLDTPRVGYLVSIRSTTLHAARLDDISADLLVEVRRITAGANNILYEFNVSASGRLLLDGRAAVVLDASALILEKS